VGLAKRGHEVTLIAAKGSTPNPSYRLVTIGGGDTVTGSAQAAHEGVFTESSRMMRKELVYMAEVSRWCIDHAAEYDLVLNNMRGGESTLIPLFSLLKKPFMTVMHLPMFAELAALFRETRTPVITISNAQRVGFDGVRYAGTVYNATDLRELPFVATPEEYLLMMGSIAPHKNQKDGILLAQKLGKKLIMAGKIGDRAYYAKEIAPYVDGKQIIHQGELSIGEKAGLLGRASALIFPIVWPEPFGLVMIEAMACGTPVVAYGNGAVPEVVKDGETGFVVPQTAGVDGLSRAVEQVTRIDRAHCRSHVEAHFTEEKMLDSLVAAIQTVTTHV
jgi:glycosyltransferase involved in cell wall biosynthesis